MHTNRIKIGFITVLVMACGLVLSGFASPAAAKNIVVTTLADTADPPFNADGPCGTGTVSDLPGADGQISLREAIIAANNTQGADTITFAPGLSGGTIMVNFDDLDADAGPDPLPALCGGQTSLNGDLDGDDVPDITLEGSALPAFVPASGLAIVSSHNTISGLRVHQFPLGITVQAGDSPIPGTPGTVEHNTVTSNIVADSSFVGIVAATGDTPGSVLAHTTITKNLAEQNGFVGIAVVANQTAAGADTQISHTTITGNEVRENGALGVYIVSFGDHDGLSNVTLAQNTVAGNTLGGILVRGGFGGADENTLETDIADNIVLDNGHSGIVVDAGVDNSSNNQVAAQIVGNTVERHQIEGIETLAGLGAVSFPTGTSNHNVLDVRIERNTVRSQTGGGIFVGAGEGSPDGRVDAVADGNQTRAIVVHNTVEDNTTKGIELDAGVQGLANANTLDIRVMHNTVCHNTIADIFGEGGFSGDILFPAPNTGSGNVLTGEISHNTAATVMVQDGTPGNTATVTQSHNTPCL
jgi:hypothetical protein